jgi:hypothetical protein
MKDSKKHLTEKLRDRYKTIPSKINSIRTQGELEKFALEDPEWMRKQKQEFIPSKKFKGIVSIYDVKTKADLAFENLDF